MSYCEILFFPYCHPTVVKLLETAVKDKNVIGKAAPTDKRVKIVFQPIVYFQ